MSAVEATVPESPVPPQLPDVLPVLPLRGMVLLPLAVVPVTIGRKRSLELVDAAMRGDRIIVGVKQRDPSVDLAGPKDLYEVGCVGMIHQMQRMPGDTVRLILQGVERVRLSEFPQEEPYLTARIARLPEPEDRSLEIEATARSLRTTFARLVKYVSSLPDAVATAVDNLDDLNQLAYVVAALVPVPPETQQEILELESCGERLRRLLSACQHEISVRELGHEIATQTERKLTEAQRRYYLREQLEAIRKELGEDEGDTVVEELRQRLDAADLPETARKEADRELARLARTPTASMEHGLIRTYLEWLSDLPWKVTTGGEIDLARAEAILDEDHYDLQKVKDRILEYIAVRKLRLDRGLAAADDSVAAPILCFVGPPGVGKTSLGQSVARALDRRFVRVSLGGVHDESELRGHRRTYVGALPGRLIEGMRRAGTADPVFMLDEIDKVGRGLHGDPYAALLEVLDPAQNRTFADHYIGVPYDLSRVLFICTANTTGTLPAPLLDRMELLDLPGYTEQEKIQIARRYLIGRQVGAHGLGDGEVTFSDDALHALIDRYTHEAGVRALDQTIAKVCRKAARRIATGRTPCCAITAETLSEFLGPPRRPPGVAERIDRPGVAAGLAWTPVGGDLLYVEAALVPEGSGRLTLTGSLGEVMQESARTAVSLVRSRAESLGVKAEVFSSRDVHIHVPGGAVPKDGPSAGVTIVAALASAVTGRLVDSSVAMTGEITLRGKVLPVGGIKEKVLAAHRSGVRHVVLPGFNLVDLDDVPPELRAAMRFTPVETIDDVLQAVLAQDAGTAGRERADEGEDPRPSGGDADGGPHEHGGARRA